MSDAEPLTHLLRDTRLLLPLTLSFLSQVLNHWGQSCSSCSYSHIGNLTLWLWSQRLKNKAPHWQMQSCWNLWVGSMVREQGVCVEILGVVEPLRTQQAVLTKWVPPVQGVLLRKKRSKYWTYILEPAPATGPAETMTNDATSVTPFRKCRQSAKA